MLGYDYEIFYKHGNHNVMENEMFLKYEVDRYLFALSSLILEWLVEAQQE